MNSTYNKPFLDLDEQVERLRERGLGFSDREQPRRALETIGYYRLSGYWYPFRQLPQTEREARPSCFVEGATLDEVLEIYYFDERLRMEVLHALSRIEVSLRFRVGYLLGRRGAFSHHDKDQLDADCAKPKLRKSPNPNCSEGCAWIESGHDRWLRKQQHNENVSSEAFIAHFNSNYGLPLPVWTAMETMSFGHLNQLFNSMKQRDRQQVAIDLDVYQADGNGDARALSSWLEHLRQTRNYCAHHARLWNRNHTAPLSVPSAVSEMVHIQATEVDESGARTISRPASRFYGTLILISYLLARIDYSNASRDRIISLIVDFAENHPERLYSMGFPSGWKDEEIWQVTYCRNGKLASRAQMLRDVDLLYTADAADRLWCKERRKERLSLLKYYRNKGAVLSVPGTQAHRYPSFQFDSQSGDVIDIVIAANRRLLNGEQKSEEDRWNALTWWTTPQDDLLNARSPLMALEDGILTSDIVNQLLAPPHGK